MEKSIVGSVVDATIQAGLQNLLSLCADGINRFWDFEKDLEQLKDSLLMIQDFLDDAEKQQVTSRAVKRWLRKLEDVAFDGEDVLGELNYHFLHKKMSPQNKKQRTVLNFFSRSIPIFSRQEMAGKIRDINKRLESINQQATSFRLQRHAGAYAPTIGSDALLDRETYSSSDGPIVIGRENDVSTIVRELLTNNSSHEQVVSVVPIVGMAGLGKTTLAKEVFNDKRIKNHFEKHIWVYVSEKFDDKAIFKKILESITGQEVGLETKEVLLRELRQNLEAKRYLLVLDDVWIEETKTLDDFMHTLSGISKAKGNGIIVTTRRESVASIVKKVGVPKLISKLSDENCWSIIKEKAFGKGHIRPEFDAIGKKIAKSCQGLPLAANVVGGLLRGKSEDEWQTIAETRLIDLGEDGDTAMKLLKLSFDYLPSPSLKKCFTYCSIFPKGYEIKREVLINLWMAEGFLQSDRTKDMEAVGNDYFNLLLQNSLLQLSQWCCRYETVSDQKCGMHDLVHDLASSISNDRTSSTRYIYVKSSVDISKQSAKTLRSLVIEGKVSDNIMFSDFKCLRALVLLGRDIEELPNIENLIHLKYLDISSTEINCLPNSVGNLCHLLTLRANPCLMEVPNTLEKLLNLRHLVIAWDPWDSRGDALRAYVTNEEIPMLGHLPHLKSLCLEGLRNVRAFGSLSQGIHDNGVDRGTITLFPALESLKLLNMPNLTELLTASETQLPEVVAFPRLEILKITDCPKLTSTSIHFPCIKELNFDCLDSSLVLEDLFVKLTSLRKLRIARVEGLVCLPDELFFNNPNLSYLSITGCPNLTHLVPSLRGGGAALRDLEIRLCPNLSQLPDDLHRLNSLEDLQISSCGNLKSITYESVQGFTSLRRLFLSHCNGLRELPSEMFESCSPSLEHLSLSSLTNFATVIGCLQNMPRLTSLELYDVPEFTNNSFRIEINSFRSLRRLTIGGMKHCDSLPDQLQHLTALRTLEFYYCRIETLPEWLGNLSSLEELVLCDCNNLKRLPSKEAMERLTRLWICRCPLLKIEQSDDNSEWPKISHIPKVDVDWVPISRPRRLVHGQVPFFQSGPRFPIFPKWL